MGTKRSPPTTAESKRTDQHPHRFTSPSPKDPLPDREPRATRSLNPDRFAVHLTTVRTCIPASIPAYRSPSPSFRVSSSCSPWQAWHLILQPVDWMPLIYKPFQARKSAKGKPKLRHDAGRVLSLPLGNATRCQPFLFEQDLTGIGNTDEIKSLDLALQRRRSHQILIPSGQQRSPFPIPCQLIDWAARLSHVLRICGSQFPQDQTAGFLQDLLESQSARPEVSCFNNRTLQFGFMTTILLQRLSCT